jgi:hypothetical protein
MRFNWGTGIALVYTTFALSTTGFVIFALQHPVELVSDDYYARSLMHDEHRTAVENADRLETVRVAISATELTIAVPAEHAGDVHGEVRLYRPSDRSADRGWALNVDRDGRQRIPLAGLQAGTWIAQIDWTSHARAYYREKRVMIP